MKFYWSKVVVVLALVTVQISAAYAVGDFSVSASPQSISIDQMSSGLSTITITSQNGFSDTVILSYSWFGEAPSGVTVDLPSPVTPPPDQIASTTIQISTSSSATSGSFVLRITAASGSITHQTDVAVNISVPATTTSTVTITEAKVNLVLRILSENLTLVIIIALVILVLSLVAHVLLHLPRPQSGYYQ